ECKTNAFYAEKGSIICDVDLGFELYQSLLRLQIKLNAQQFEAWETVYFISQFRFYLYLWLRCPEKTIDELDSWHRNNTQNIKELICDSEEIRDHSIATSEHFILAVSQITKRIKLKHYQRVIYSLPFSWDKHLFITILGKFYSGEIVFCEKLENVILN